ncbi:DUF72 domain-containing protein [Steroidobacter flavus]|uniref:DUF72 domain-containing protein n=1 Tax=Steroidobacter flavus TaxID=1842136 RepID=A0ABV8STZ1_9GAMM
MASKSRVKTARRLFIGAAGWSIPSRYGSELPGEGSHLERYARRLQAVEINSSFYRHHRAQTYARWAASVPKDFRFAVKAPQVFTHEGELRAHSSVLGQFAEEIAGLGKKLGVVLVQLPPKLEFDAAATRRFFRAVRKRIDVQFVCEPRHATWGSEKADRLLAELSVTRVAADPPLWPGANEPGGDRRVAYFRWHGQPQKYFSDYGAECLALLEKQITAAAATQAWAMFDNTAHGHALRNALSLTDALGPARSKTGGQ